jgi:hypothetical protein
MLFVLVISVVGFDLQKMEYLLKQYTTITVSLKRCTVH